MSVNMMLREEVSAARSNGRMHSESREHALGRSPYVGPEYKGIPLFQPEEHLSVGTLIAQELGERARGILVNPEPRFGGGRSWRWRRIGAALLQGL